MIQENTQSRTSVQSIVTRPILFSGEMVQAIRSGRKTQTRRVITPQPDGEFFGPKTYHPSITDRRGDMRPGPEQFGIFDTSGEWSIRCPYGCPGDRLWVRETFVVCADSNIFYRADGKPDPWDEVKWKPSIFMPRNASRITLEIRNVSVERLHDIDEEDAKAEGYPGTNVDGKHIPWSARGWFEALWHSINGVKSWDANPFVWVVGFKVV